ncbi:helix-turn-helix domain-containing protein [Olsenella phocaeensis]|uniref:helix-turn-helix domain-containing protein n=1 Tax=Olsenella phocaeensis TaxID=1852385 RepID=UPI003A9062D0
MARPKISQEMIDRAAKLKRSGLTNKDICAALGITEQTFYRWLSKPSCKLHRSLSESIKKAEADYKAELLQTILTTATREKNPQWTAAAWLLERKYPDEYAQTTRQRDDGREDVPQIVLGVEVRTVEGGNDD